MGPAVIEKVFGARGGVRVTKAIRLVESRARVPRYERETPQVLARMEETSVDHVLTRELEDVASAHAEELVGVTGFAMGMQWPAVSQG